MKFCYFCEIMKKMYRVWFVMSQEWIGCARLGWEILDSWLQYSHYLSMLSSMCSYKASRVDLCYSVWLSLDCVTINGPTGIEHKEDNKHTIDSYSFFSPPNRFCWKTELISLYRQWSEWLWARQAVAQINHSQQRRLVTNCDVGGSCWKTGKYRFLK